MWIEEGVIHCRASRYTELERSWLTEYLTLRHTVRRRGEKPREKRERLYNVLSDTFPAGLLPKVLAAAEADGIAVEVLDRRTPPCAPDPGADLSWLYPFQMEAVRTVWEKTRGILWIPTGGGKTEVAVALVKSLDCRWLFLVHRASLLRQTAEVFRERCGEEAGVVGDGGWRESSWFTVAMFQTVYAALRSKRPAERARAVALLEGARGVVVDECHCLPAASYMRVIMRTRGAYWRVGLSGTPLQRGDERSALAVAAIGPPVYRVRADELHRLGRLARPVIRMVVVEQPPVDAPTWQGVEGRAVVRSSARNRALTKMALRAAKPCMCFVKQLRHGELLRQKFEAAGLRAEFAQGKHSTTWRENLVRSLERGDVDVLLCTVIFQEGADVPSLASVINAGGLKSAIAALQRLGRGARTDGGRKEEFEMWDVKDVGNRWLERHTRARLRAYASEGFEVTEVELP